MQSQVVQSTALAKARESSNGFSLHGITDEIEYESCQGTEALQYLDVSNMSVLHILRELRKYTLVAERKESFALHLGKPLMATVLCEQISGIFSVRTPNVVDGPHISWAKIVLTLGPSPQLLDGMDPITVRGSLIKLAEPDRALLRSGRPWRFLSPWPEPKDRERELCTINSTLEEIERIKGFAGAAFSVSQKIENQLRSRKATLIDAETCAANNLNRATFAQATSHQEGISVQETRSFSAPAEYSRLPPKPDRPECQESERRTTRESSPLDVDDSKKQEEYPNYPSPLIQSVKVEINQDPLLKDGTEIDAAAREELGGPRTIPNLQPISVVCQKRMLHHEAAVHSAGTAQRLVGENCLPTPNIGRQSLRSYPGLSTGGGPERTGSLSPLKPDPSLETKGGISGSCTTEPEARNRPSRVKPFPQQQKRQTHRTGELKRRKVAQ